MRQVKRTGFKKLKGLAILLVMAFLLLGCSQKEDMQPIKPTESTITIVIDGSLHSQNIEIGEPFSIVAPMKAHYRFLYWKEAGFIVTYDTHLSFDVTQDHRVLEAYYAAHEDHVVYITDHHQNILTEITPIHQAGDRFSIDVSHDAFLSHPGYITNGFKQELDQLTFSQGETRLYLALAYLKTDERQYQITIDDRVIEADYDEVVEISLQESESSFSHWEINGKKVSQASSFFWTVTSDVTFSAAFHEDVFEPHSVYLREQFFTQAHQGAMHLSFDVKIETNANIVEVGVLLTSSLEIDELTLDHQDIVLRSTSINAYGEVKLTSQALELNTMWRARPYLITYDALSDEYEVTYGNKETFFPFAIFEERLFQDWSGVPARTNHEWIGDYEGRWTSFDEFPDRTIAGERFDPYHFYSVSHSNLHQQERFIEFNVEKMNVDVVKGIVGISDSGNTTYPLQFVVSGDGVPLYQTTLHHGEVAKHYAIDISSVTWLRFSWSAETVSSGNYANRIVFVEPVFLRSQSLETIELKQAIENQIAHWPSASALMSIEDYTDFKDNLHTFIEKNGDISSLGNIHRYFAIGHHIESQRLSMTDLIDVASGSAWLRNIEHHWDYQDRTVNGYVFDTLKTYSISHSDLDVSSREIHFDLSKHALNFVEGFVGAADEAYLTTTHPPMWDIFVDGTLKESIPLIYGEDPVYYSVNLQGAKTLTFALRAESTYSHDNTLGYANRPVITEPVFYGKPIVSVESRLLREGTPDETALYTIDTHIPGPTVFIVAGIHGSERGGWHAAMRLLGYAYNESDQSWSFDPDLGVYPFERGVIHILPRAYIRATHVNHRFVSGEDDLNRQFPGNPEGTHLEQLAYAITEAMILANPDIAFDFHEARSSYTTGNIGDSVIMWTQQYTHRAFLDRVLDDFNDQFNPDVPFKRINGAGTTLTYGTFSGATGIPMFLVETHRGGGNNTNISTETIPLEYRIQQHIDLLSVFLDHMNDPWRQRYARTG